jgi:hypothetical protein
VNARETLNCRCPYPDCADDDEYRMSGSCANCRTKVTGVFTFGHPVQQSLLSCPKWTDKEYSPDLGVHESAGPQPEVPCPVCPRMRMPADRVGETHLTCRHDSNMHQSKAERDMSTFACVTEGGRREIVVAEYDRTLFDTSASAWFSEDRAYRYLLTRDWGDGPVMTWIMLNPSTADAFTSDPTCTRVIQFARREKCTGIRVVNLYGLRATDPAVLRTHPDPVGPCNDRFIDDCTRGLLVVAGWGSHGVRDDRGLQVSTRLDAAGVHLLCLGQTASGQPRHPLYVRSDTPLVRYEPAAKGVA